MTVFLFLLLLLVFVLLHPSNHKAGWGHSALCCSSPKGHPTAVLSPNHTRSIISVGANHVGGLYSQPANTNHNLHNVHKTITVNTLAGGGVLVSAFVNFVVVGVCVGLVLGVCFGFVFFLFLFCFVFVFCVFLFPFCVLWGWIVKYIY